ncbi:GDP-mannose mannosyl hydrolase [Sphingobium yanoikuyae]|uniref:GDP-mannose mannosyl hydrolase n=1 Tax=Sphingobium yanoikuyae TaxID=13690 RepID=UPI001478749D|nr:NUDIX domain-containing protein [Sphingobium yanoikuyae]
MDMARIPFAVRKGVQAEDMPRPLVGPVAFLLLERHASAGTGSAMADNTDAPGYLNPQIFTMAVDALPLISMDLCVTNTSGQLMLGLRKNPPAQGFWFTPGGRIRKGESQHAAFQRLMNEELTLTQVTFDRATLMGAWDHFYEDSAFSSITTTHYVNLPYLIQLTEEEEAQISLNGQHVDWRWFDVLRHEDDIVHPYAQTYLDWIAHRRAVE